MTIRRYSELRRFDTFEDRFEYLRLNGSVGRETFGFERYINQKFYSSREWRNTRRDVIARDLGCDLGSDSYEIHSGLLIHHMNPITADDIKLGDPAVFDPDFLITTTHATHNAIHYGDAKRLPRRVVERRPGDTRLW